MNLNIGILYHLSITRRNKAMKEKRQKIGHGFIERRKSTWRISTDRRKFKSKIKDNISFVEYHKQFDNYKGENKNG